MFLDNVTYVCGINVTYVRGSDQFSPTVGPYRDWHHGLRYVVPNRDWGSLRSMLISNSHI